MFASVEELVQAVREDSRMAREALKRAPDVFPPI
jgi:hypothetical protein